MLFGLFGALIVPPSAWAEALAPGRSAASLVGTADLRVQAPQDTQVVVSLRRDLRLGSGEAEALILARELGALLLLDERRGRRHATTLGIRHIGVLGLLLLAKRRGLIAHMAPLVADLRRTGLYLSDVVIGEVLRLAGEAAD